MGRAALYSPYNNNSFASLRVVPIEGKTYYIQRFDDTDECFEYSGEWEHNLMCGFAEYKRTLSTGKTGAEVKFTFSGTDFALFGKNTKGTQITAYVDGNAEAVTLADIGSREIFFAKNGLANGIHKIIIKINSGVLNIDGAQINA